MHYAEFAEDEVSHFVRLSIPCIITPDQLTLLQSAALLAAIKEYEQSKWKVIGQKVGKPAKVSGRPLNLLSSFSISSLVTWDVVRQF
jgi:hypothetical protein